MKEKEKNQELLKKLDRTKEEAKKGKILIPIEIVYYDIKFLHQAGEKVAYINFDDNDFFLWNCTIKHISRMHLEFDSN